MGEPGQLGSHELVGGVGEPGGGEREPRVGQLARPVEAGQDVGQLARQPRAARYVRDPVRERAHAARHPGERRPHRCAGAPVPAREEHHVPAGRLHVHLPAVGAEPVGGAPEQLPRRRRGSRHEQVGVHVHVEGDGHPGHLVAGGGLVVQQRRHEHRALTQ